MHFNKINKNLGKKLKKGAQGRKYVHSGEQTCSWANNKKNGTVLYFSKRALRGDLHRIENS